MKRSLFLLLSLAVALTAACTNREGETEAPVFITVDLRDQPGFVDVSLAAPVQIQTIILISHLKSATQTDPQGFSDVNIEGYTVRFRRTDGGTRVPAVQTFGAGILVPSGGTATLNNFPVLPGSAIQQSPFDQLLPFNGGIDRETGRDEIQTAFDLTFFGHTVSGHRITSQTASGILLFRFGGSSSLRARPGR
jgi:hypothetical protein